MKTHPTTNELVTAVRELSRAKYESSYGWQVIEECLTDDEVAQRLDVANVKTLTGARRWARDFAKLHTDMQFEPKW
jgi:hypothetical protein